MKITSKTILASAFLVAAGLFANAQDNNAPGGGRGNFNPEEFRARMAERLKTSLKVTNDEWTVLQPLIEKVTTKQRESMAGRFGGFGGRGGDRGGNGGGGAGGGDRGGSAESQALRDALEKDGTTPEEITAKLNAVRESRKKATTELAAAREELKKVVSVRQEAVLFSMGILE